MLSAKLTFQSFKNRKLNVTLALASIVLGSALFSAVEQVRSGVKESFSNTISSTDLIIGARSGATSVLLSTVFHIGSPANNIDIKTFEHFKEHEAVEWAVPLSFGDSHHGFRVAGTTPAFFKHYKYRDKQPLVFKTGEVFKELYDVVIGAHVADELNYNLKDSLVLSHGLSQDSFENHEHSPFAVSGILKKTGTVIDRSLFISLHAVEAIHADWGNADYFANDHAIPEPSTNPESFEVRQVSAFLLRAKARVDVLRLQREAADYKPEPISAVIPGLTLASLWSQLGNLEAGFLSISTMVVLVSLVSMLIAVSSSLNERRREIAVLRSLGAGPLKIFTMMTIESTLLAFTGGLLGIAAAYFMILALSRVIADLSGVYVTPATPGVKELLYLSVLTVSGFLVGLIPAVKAYRMTLKDGLMIKL